MEPQLVAIGGGGFSNGPENLLLEDYILSLANKPNPKVSFVPTASGDSEQYLLKFYIAFAKLHATASHLPLFRLAVTDLRSYMLALFNLISTFIPAEIPSSQPGSLRLASTMAGRFNRKNLFTQKSPEWSS